MPPVPYFVEFILKCFMLFGCYYNGIINLILQLFIADMVVPQFLRGEWFQDPLWIPKSLVVETSYIKWHSFALVAYNLHISSLKL
jgi:hypothetical protein